MAFTCPYCQHEESPHIETRLSSNGWLTLVLLLLFCFPLFWLPLVIDSFKEEVRICRGCRVKIGVGPG